MTQTSTFTAMPATTPDHGATHTFTLSPRTPAPSDALATASTLTPWIDATVVGGITSLQIEYIPPPDARVDRVVTEAVARITNMRFSNTLPGGQVVEIRGAASSAILAALAHELSEYYRVVAIFDETLGKYIVCITKDPLVPIGYTLERA